ncbi:MAG: ATP-binding protein [Saprospiraceae bacterium]|nr:ATP-binding protein [Saprospiraceae bacterium]
MAESPFLFLAAYEKKDKNKFFGRTKEVAQLYNAVHASNLILLYGTSGTGKTSLVNCGLANQFHDTDWLPIFVRRNSDLNQSLDLAVSKYVRSTGKDDTLVQRIRHIYREQFKPVYLLFDQFEELYILGSRQEQGAFHATIADLLQSGVQCKVLLIMREEYLASLDGFEKAVPSLFDNRLRIERMNNLGLSKVILGTAQEGSIEIAEPKVTVHGILDNIRDKREGIDLTNLQVYLKELWDLDMERQTGGQKLPDENYVARFDPALVKKAGRIQNVLSDFLDKEMEALELRLEQQGVEHAEGLPLEILFTLVTDDGTKRPMDLESIVKGLPKHRRLDSQHLQYCMKEFERIRLLTPLTSD